MLCFHFICWDGCVKGYDDGNPLIDKSEFVLSLFEQLDKKGVSATEKSIIDRCTAAVYDDYYETGRTPTLCVLGEKLLEQEEREAKDLALALELFTSGSLDAFKWGDEGAAVLFLPVRLGEKPGMVLPRIKKEQDRKTDTMRCDINRISVRFMVRISLFCVILLSDIT